MVVKLKIDEMRLKFCFFRKWYYFCQLLFAQFLLLSRSSVNNRTSVTRFLFEFLSNDNLPLLTSCDKLKAYFFSHLIHFLSNHHLPTTLFLHTLCT